MGLLFLDEEEDLITITSQDDLDILLALYEDKDYAKVNVEGTLITGGDAIEQPSAINDWPSIEEVKEEVAPEEPQQVEEKTEPEPEKAPEVEQKEEEIYSSKIASEPEPQPEEEEPRVEEPEKPAEEPATQGPAVAEEKQEEALEEKAEVVQEPVQEVKEKI